MFFNEPAEVLGIAKQSSCVVFVMPADVAVEIKGATMLAPEEKSVITIEQIKQVIEKTNIKQLEDHFIIIRPADKMSEEGANAFLKSLEEPKERIHFVLITDSPSAILPTILSRAAIYFLKDKDTITSDIRASEKVKDVARRLLVAKPQELPSLAEEITKKKDGVRSYALEVVGVTIEMLYKSYFMTGKVVFLKKLPKFLRLYENLAKNGHIKLHIVADLL